MSEAISSSGDVPETESVPNSSSVNSNNNNSNNNHTNGEENNVGQSTSTFDNPFAKISSSDDAEESDTADGFFAAPIFKFKSSRSFQNYASSLSAPTESNGESSSSISFVSLDKKNIGQMKLPDNIQKLEEAKAAAATSSDNISSSSDMKDSTETPPKPTLGAVLFGQNFTNRVASDGIKSTSDLISFSDISNSGQSTSKAADEEDTKINSTNPDKKSGPTFGTFDDKSKESFSSGDKLDEKEDSEAIKGLKRSYEVISGEEDEQSVMAVPGSLYNWDSEKGEWTGKGKGTLKLNDSKEGGDNSYSRLLVRSLGVHKVLLNARLVPGMKVELAGETSIRLMNVDGLYLFKSKKKLDDLLELIDDRMVTLNKRSKTEPESSEAEAV